LVTWKLETHTLAAIGIPIGILRAIGILGAIGIGTRIGNSRGGYPLRNSFDNR
jgi:hypothetical protein